MTHITRRQFVKGSVAAGLTAFVGPMSRVQGANDEIRVAVVGVNGRGGSHVSAFEEMEGVRVVAFCDVDRKVLESKAAGFEKKYGRKVDTYVDIRKLLEDKNIDAVSIATPNHWHSLCTIWACQAGKDVYVEKPCSHNVVRGPQVRRGRPQVQPDRAARHAEPLQPELGQAGGRHRQRQVRQAAGLQARRPRTDRAAGASASSRSRSRPRTWTSTSGSAPPRSSRTTRTSFTTTGTGSGTSATATSATRASTRWTSPAGRFPARRCPRA